MLHADVEAQPPAELQKESHRCGPPGLVARPQAVPVVAVGCGIACPLLLPIGRFMMGVKRKKWKAIPE